jgi:hypothetical protein
MDWRSQGSAQRRRMGAHSNHYEAGATNMAASNIPTPEEALAGMARIGSPREPMGMAGFSFSAPSASPETGTIMPKGHSKSVDPSVMNTGPGTRPYAAYDRNGAHYGVAVMYRATMDPSAGQTQANARIVPSVAMRSNPNFAMGIEASRA